MNLFRKRYSVCEKCHVHFEPWEGPGSHLCENHRVEWLDRERRRSVVFGWANANWERLEEQMQKEQIEQTKNETGKYTEAQEMYARQALAGQAAADQGSQIFASSFGRL